MNDEEVILSIKVDYSEAISGIQLYEAEVRKLKQEQKDLEKAMDEGKATQEQRDQYVKNQAVIRSYQEDLRQLRKEMDNNMRVEKANNDARADSLNSLRASLSVLTRQYDEMGKAEREGAEGKALQKHINDITTELKAAEEETQRYYRNVGNYENAIQNALGANSKWYQQLTMIRDITAGGLKQGLATATTAVTTFGRSLLGLLANPIVATLAAIAAALKLLSDAIKNNEENTDKWRIITAPLGRILELISNQLQIMAGAILKVVSTGGQLIGWVGQMLEKIPILGKYIKEFNDELRDSVELELEAQAIRNARRKEEVDSAKASLEVQRLLTKAYDKANYSAKERLAFLRQATKLEQERADKQTELAKREFDYAKRSAEISKNDEKTNDELAAKEAAYWQAQQQREAMQTSLKQRESRLLKEIASERTKDAKAATDAAKNKEEAAKKELAAIRSAEDALTKLIKDEYERRRVEIETSYKRRIEDLKRQLTSEKNLTTKAREAINTEILAQEKLLQEELNKLSIENLEKRVQQETERLNYLLQAVGNDYLKRRELTLRQIDADEALQESRIAKEIQDEAKREQVLEAMHLAYDAKRLATEQEFDKAIQDEQASQIQRDFQMRIDPSNDELETARLQMEERLALLNNMHQLEGESIEAFNQRKLDAERAYQQSKKAYTDMEVKREQEKVKAIGQAVGALGDLMEEAGENNTAAARLAKVLALAEIAINSGVAISAGIKQAQTTGPFPANIAAIATTIAAIMSGITAALKAVKGAKFAQGGTITGAGTGTSDSIPARVSNGESVITANATTLFSPVLSALNQLGDGVPIIAANPQTQMGEDMLAAAVAKGMALAPRPVVSVQEINDVERRVEVIQSIASI